MQEKKRYIGYLCPHCRKAVTAERTAFSLSASGAVISCDCGASDLTVETGEDRIRVSVPCGICGSTHTAEATLSAVLDGNGVGFACPETKQLSCFIGDETAVERAMDELRVSAQKTQEEGETFADSVIMYEVLSELKEIAAREHGISCTCGSERYKMQIGQSYIDLECLDCGAKFRIPAATDEDLDALCCHMKLQIKGRGEK